MQVTLRNKVIICVVALAGAYAFGRYTVPVKIVTETKVVEVEKKDTKSDEKQSKKRHRDSTTVIVKKPDGTVETTVKTVEDDSAGKDTTVATATKVTDEKDDKKEVIKDSGHLTISALAGANPFNFSSNPGIVYGAHVQRDILGPIGIGVWALSNGTCGMSVGLRF